MRASFIVLGSCIFGHLGHARSIPQNVRDFYNAVKSGQCTGSNNLRGGFYDEDGGELEWSYCQKRVKGQAIFLQGPNSFANMDIDCDGKQSGHNDGRCGNSADTQSETRWVDEVRKFGISDLDANIHPYVVFGNEGNYSPTFDPRKFGVKPLSVMAVVCNDQLIYGVWGDTNGDDGKPLVGEASISLAIACFGNDITGNNGHDEADMLYVAFTGDDAQPGPSANWRADKYADFEASVEGLGDKLIERL